MNDTTNKITNDLESAADSLSEIKVTVNRLGVVLCVISLGMFLIFLSTVNFKTSRTYTRTYKSTCCYEVEADVKDFIEKTSKEDEGRVLDVEFYTDDSYADTEYHAIIVYELYY